MSNSLQDKMYNHAETPPETAWHTIALTLDELFQLKETADKLKDLEIAPPSSAWNKITAAIDEEPHEKIRKSFATVEVTPPASAWNKIAQQLDELPIEEFSTRLYEYEVIPPTANWQKIASSLDGEQAKIIPVSKNYNKVIRIAAAAAIMGFLAWAGYNLLNKSTNNNLANNDTALIVPVKTPVIKTNEQPGEIKGNNPVVANNNDPVKPAVVAIKKTITPAKKEQELTEEIAATDLHTDSDAIATADTKNLHKKNTITAASSDNNNTEARYLVYLTDQGNMIKLSKKLADLKCIYTKDGEVSQQALAKLDQSQCNDQLKYWQEKMANSSLQSSSNPLELIEILK